MDDDLFHRANSKLGATTTQRPNESWWNTGVLLQWYIISQARAGGQECYKKTRNQCTVVSYLRGEVVQHGDAYSGIECPGAIRQPHAISSKHFRL